MKYDNNYSDDMPVKTGGRGFYIALALCLVAVCGVAVTTFVGNLNADTPKTENTTVPVRTTDGQQVVIPATNVRDDRTTATTVTTTTTVPVTTVTTASADLFVFPVSNKVLLPYSESLLYSETLGAWHTHNGVDFAADVGAMVKAPADGTIKRIYQDGLWGAVIEIDHGGKVISRCCGVAPKSVKEGDAVKAGQTIGTVSEIPAEIVGDSHVHLEVLANEKYVDPLLLIRGETVKVTSEPTATTK